MIIKISLSVFVFVSVSINHCQSVGSLSPGIGIFHTTVCIHLCHHVMCVTLPICARLTVPSMYYPDGSRCAVSAWIPLRNYPSTEDQWCHSFPVITHNPQRPGQVTCRWAITCQLTPQHTNARCRRSKTKQRWSGSLRTSAVAHGSKHTQAFIKVFKHLRALRALILLYNSISYQNKLKTIRQELYQLYSLNFMRCMLGHFKQTILMVMEHILMLLRS